MAVDERVTTAYTYAVTKALHRVTGDASAAVLNKAALDLVQHLERLGLEIARSSDEPGACKDICDLLTKLRITDSPTCTIEDARIELSVPGCSIAPLTNQFMEENEHPGSCPVAMMVEALVERDLGKRCRLTKLSHEPGGTDSTLHFRLADHLSQ
jgi:hypothetical protein